MNNKNIKQIKTIQVAGIINILFGVCTTLIFALTFLSNITFGGKPALDMEGLMTNTTFNDMYMSFQLCTVILGVISIVYGFKMMRIKNAIMFQISYFVAGINCMLLMFMGVVLFIAPLNIVAGVKMFGLLKKEEVNEEDDDEFGGTASALDDQKSTAEVIDEMLKNEDLEDEDVENTDDTDEIPEVSDEEEDK